MKIRDIIQDTIDCVNKMLLYTAIDYGNSNEYQNKAFISILSYILITPESIKIKVYTNNLSWWMDKIKNNRLSMKD